MSKLVDSTHTIRPNLILSEILNYSSLYIYKSIASGDLGAIYSYIHIYILYQAGNPPFSLSLFLYIHYMAPGLLTSTRTVAVRFNWHHYYYLHEDIKCSASQNKQTSARARVNQFRIGNNFSSQGHITRGFIYISNHTIYFLWNCESRGTIYMCTCVTL